ncbi:DUF262 domain-containing protein [Neisseria zalophi]|uniref:DUF262 domain-containing protein n=1 Tax=Neisseria zalophi TaxID=640030 RepID=A0A5J6Q047_9NEIS|nr:DUF262 domain-containing protein [Neisseria zalophi]QEY26427.1 DUF262 domain-containing protein [Neisseria zalophi]
MSEEQIQQFSIEELLSDNSHYLIPIYQRNYAWGEKEIKQLIQDIIDYILKQEQEQEQQPYYIGTLVVFKRKLENETNETFEIIDGQQRLTTLFLLAAYLKNEHKENKKNKLEDLKLEQDKLRFESRTNSEKTLEVILKSANLKGVNWSELTDEQLNIEMKHGYELIRSILPNQLKDKEMKWSKFVSFLLEKVKIMRVEVPEDTDLNHYFEIMNSRGEQLEKHEILKARMLEKLENDIQGQECLNIIWEACANMGKYVQMGFTVEQRDQIFGEDWNTFQKDFVSIKAKIIKQSEESADATKESIESLGESLDELIKNTAPIADDKNNSSQEQNEQFQSVIDFPNFLLQVLCIQIGHESDMDKVEGISLDDKKLLDVFEEQILKPADAKQKVKKFMVNLLRCRWLYDQYIIKRYAQDTKSKWALKRFIKEGGKSKGNVYKNTFDKRDDEDNDGKQIIMLQTAFHVSMPGMPYKYWLNAALYYLFNQDAVTNKAYKEHLESVARSFMLDRFLVKQDSDVKKQDYFDIIYKYQSKPQNIGLLSNNMEEGIEEPLSYGHIENNFVFNYLDYLLWKDEKYQIDKKIRDYEFTFRSSVEHYYPQHPINNDSSGENRLTEEDIHSFGNLCLISHSQNSKLSNYSPNAKKEHYQGKEHIDSIKQYLMMKEEDKWEAEQIQKHYKEMIEILKKGLATSSS